MVSLRAFISKEDPSAAGEVGARILAAVSSISDHPAIGRPGRVSGTRELIIPDMPYLVPYRVRSGDVEILRVLHAARRWPRRF
jgi:plasmid stabilization system protein ParE